MSIQKFIRTKTFKELPLESLFVLVDANGKIQPAICRKIHHKLSSTINCEARPAIKPESDCRGLIEYIRIEDDEWVIECV